MTQTSLSPGGIIGSALSRVGPVFVPVALLALPINILPLLIPTLTLKAIVNVLVAIVVAPILGGASIVLVNRALANEKVDLGTALSMAWQRAAHLILLTLLLVVILIPSFMLLVPGIYLSVRLFASQYEVMLERQAPMDALKTSWAMTEGRWWEIFRPLFAIGLVVFIPFMILSVIFMDTVFGSWVNGLLGVAVTPMLVMSVLMVYKIVKGQAMARA